MGLVRTENARLQGETVRFSLAWLTAANLVGLLLSLCLLYPGIDTLLGPLTYGRWMPLHMEWQLYGWCSLPLLGLILKEFPGRSGQAAGEIRFVFVVWSIGLLAGGISCLSGHASGKLFLSWEGWARALFPLTLCLVWAVLATNWLRQLPDPVITRGRKVWRAILLLALAGVPFSLYITSSRTLYPPVDPTSGGATGHSLLASSLAILGLFGALPFLLGLRRRESVLFRLYWVLYLACVLVYLLIQHGSVANTGVDQVAGLGSLVILVPALVGYFRIWAWPAGSRYWMIAFLAWWGVLTIDGWITFLPGFLDRLKFTNGMVGHAHLAMAGMITALNFVILSSLKGEDTQREAHCFGGKRTFLIWNGACFTMVAVLLLQGWQEGAHPEVLFGPDRWTVANYAIRTLAGALMLLAGLSWTWKAISKNETL